MANTGPCHSRVAKTLLNTYNITTVTVLNINTNNININTSINININY